jgi:hypothetical protein
VSLDKCRYNLLISFLDEQMYLTINFDTIGVMCVSLSMLRQTEVQPMSTTHS